MIMKTINELLNFGLINIDKPAGPTSFSVSEFVRRELGLGKTSHMGTLDPKVTGVLPITLGRACKLARYFIRHDKTYIGVLETHKVCDIVELQKLIDKNFVGKIRQTPPHRSAVARVEREREVYFWKLLESSDDKKHFLFECKVEGGTYIRKLCSDLGEMISGAHMGELRRISAGIFDETADADRPASPDRPKLSVSDRPLRWQTNLVTLYDFEKAVEAWKGGDDNLLRGMIVPAEDAIRKVLPIVEVDKSMLKLLWTGKPLLRSNVISGKVKSEEKFAAFCGDVFVGVYRAIGKSGVFGQVEFVKN